MRASNTTLLRYTAIAHPTVTFVTGLTDMAFIRHVRICSSHRYDFCHIVYILRR
jgi:hypothetical protein